MAYDDIPKDIRDFLFYLDVVTGKSKKTIYEYYLDLRYYFKFLKALNNNSLSNIDNVDILDVDIEFIKKVTLENTYQYLYHMKMKHFVRFYQ